MSTDKDYYKDSEEWCEKEPICNSITQEEFMAAVKKACEENKRKPMEFTFWSQEQADAFEKAVQDVHREELEKMREIMYSREDKKLIEDEKKAVLEKHEKQLKAEITGCRVMKIRRPTNLTPKKKKRKR